MAHNTTVREYVQQNVKGEGVKDRKPSRGSHQRTIDNWVGIVRDSKGEIVDMEVSGPESAAEMAAFRCVYQHEKYPRSAEGLMIAGTNGRKMPHEIGVSPLPVREVRPKPHQGPKVCRATITMGDSTFTFELPNGATLKIDDSPTRLN